VERTFHLTILGSNSAVPAYGRFPTSQVLQVNKHLFLIDCGEGTQIRMAQYRIKRNKISQIFISHLHGDHVYGLPGLLTSMSLNNRQAPLTVFGPKGLRKMLMTQLELSMAYIGFDLQVTELEEGYAGNILAMEDVSVSCFPVFHRVPCFAYRFDEQTLEKNIIKEAIGIYDLSIEEIKLAKQGQDIRRQATIIPNSELTHPTDEPASYAFCADSEARDELLPYLKDLSALYFETTYLDDMADQAHERGHATSVSAATLAARAGVRLLISGHYSSRYRDIEAFRREIEPHFTPLVLGRDGEMVNILDYTPDRRQD